MKKSDNLTKNPRKVGDASMKVGVDARVDEASAERYPPESIEVLRGMPLAPREAWNIWICIPDDQEAC